MSEPVVIAVDQQNLFLKNMALLWNVDPQLAYALDRLDEASLPPLEPTTSGDCTLRRTTPAGATLQLHSRHDPWSQADAWVARHLEPDRYCYIVLGCGLAYHLRRLADELHGEECLAVIEPDLPVLRQALTLHDFSMLLFQRRLTFITTTNKNQLHEHLHAFAPFMMLGVKIADFDPAVQVSRSFYDQIRPALLEYVEYIRMSMLTLLTNAQTTCRHIGHNLADYLTTMPINPLKNRFARTPVVIVSAGPSLLKNIQLLIEAQQHVVIIATATTFKPLLARGIIPDFVCALDYHELSRQYFEGLEKFPTTRLVAEPKAHPAIISTFRGPVHLLHNEFAQLCLGACAQPRDSLYAGASVAHLAFYLAEYLGGDPIIFIGQDLALTGHVYYAPGTSFHEACDAETNRFCTMEMKEWDGIVRYKSILRRVRSATGHELFTEDLMYTYLEQFEKDFARTVARVIDATEGGAVKRGAKMMTLAAALREFAMKPLNKVIAIPPAKNNQSRLLAVREHLQKTLQELHQIEQLCQDTLAVLDELETLLDDAPRFNQKIKDVDRLRGRMRELDYAYRLIIAGAQLAEFRKFAADQRLKSAAATGVERARQQLQRDRNFVREFQTDARFMISIFEGSLANLNVRIESLIHPEPT
ncbi:MAG: hypothetical protein HJJLKODD_00808 [Phycisphaerae bacterium]|nr:hypothetical protein [Phycisphaerae bacterium]